MEPIWKKHIRAELQGRDRRQKEGYEGLLETYLKLLDRLDLQNFLAEKLHLEPHSNEYVGSHASAHKPMCLEEAGRQIQHQLELAELHKDRAELAHTVLDLNKTLRLKDVEIHDHCARISKQAHDISTLTRRYQDQAAYVEELERQHQLLQDEHSVLQLTYVALDERLQRTRSENQHLVARWMEEKALEADRLNLCNEQEEMYRRLLSKLRRRMERLKKSPMTCQMKSRFQTLLRWMLVSKSKMRNHQTLSPPKKTRKPQAFSALNMCLSPWAMCCQELMGTSLDPFTLEAMWGLCQQRTLARAVMEVDINRMA